MKYKVSQKDFKLTEEPVLIKKILMQVIIRVKIKNQPKNKIVEMIMEILITKMKSST